MKFWVRENNSEADCSKGPELQSDTNPRGQNTIWTYFRYLLDFIIKTAKKVPCQSFLSFEDDRSQTSLLWQGINWLRWNEYVAGKFQASCSQNTDPTQGCHQDGVTSPCRGTGWHGTISSKALEGTCLRACMHRSLAYPPPWLHHELHESHEEITLASQLPRSYKESRAGDEEEPTEGHQLGLWSPTVSTTTCWNADFMGSVAGPEAG